MKYIFKTDDEIEAKQLMAAKDAISIIYDIQEYLIKSDGISEKAKDDIFEMINEIKLEELWARVNGKKKKKLQIYQKKN